MLFRTKLANASVAIRKAGVGRVTAIIFPLAFLIYILWNEILVSRFLRSDSISSVLVSGSSSTTNGTSAAQRALDDAAASAYAHNIIQQRRWSGRQPSWCGALIQSPRSGHADCGRSRFDAVCADGKPSFFSKHDQDMFLWMQHWRHLRRRGTYADISSNEPVRFSNTFFYDRCMEWNGVCVQPDPMFHAWITRYRSCALFPTCVSNRLEKLQLSVHGESRTERQKLNITCQRTTVALRATIAGAVTKIDMLSLSAQGNEFRVLSGIDWGRTTISVIIIETVSNATEQLFRTLRYKRIVQPSMNANGTLSPVSVFLHKDVEWGRPR